MRLLALLEILLWATLVVRVFVSAPREVKGWHPALAFFSSIALATWVAS